MKVWSAPVKWPSLAVVSVEAEVVGGPGVRLGSKALTPEAELKELPCGQRDGAAGVGVVGAPVEVALR